MLLRNLLLRGTAAAAVLSLASLQAHAAKLQVGSDNVAVIEPEVSHPAETPCIVKLTDKATFFDFNTAPISFTPPAGCPPPWAKVVLSVSVSLNAGVQFDRTGQIFLGGVPIWFGTTSEPSSKVAPRWQFTRDVTSYTALFEAAQSGYESIGNIVNGTYTSTITSSSELRFYPVTTGAPAPVTADMVLPLPQGGGASALNGPTDTISTTMTFPTNVLKAKLDLYLQGQGGDEFWYTCVPNSLTGPLESCGGGSLREGEVTVDSTPAGVAPVYPWVFTGGIDPDLWTPIPGVQTLDFKPFQVDLSPFAGVLSNGAPHTIAASVYGDNNYFSASGALLLFLDHGAATVTGGVTTDTLAATPVVQTYNNTVTNNGITTGTLDTSDLRNFTISGTVTGSAGTTTNTVQQLTSFRNDQSFDISDTEYQQIIHQQTKIAVRSTSSTGSVKTVSETALNWPFDIGITVQVGADGGERQTTSVNQQYLANAVTTQGAATLFQSSLSDMLQTTDSLDFDNQGAFVGNRNQAESASYHSAATGEACFSRTLAAAANKLTVVQTGC